MGMIATGYKPSKQLKIIEAECLHSASYFLACLLGASPRASDFVASPRLGYSIINPVKHLSKKFFLQHISKTLYCLPKRFRIIQYLFIIPILQRISPDFQSYSESARIGTKVIAERPFRRFGLGNNPAGAKSVDTPGNIQHPAERINIPSGFFAYF